LKKTFSRGILFLLSTSILLTLSEVNMTYERIMLEFKDDIAVLTLNHPEALNAISAQMNEEIREGLKEVAQPEKGARCLLITGAGRGFCAGANIKPSSREASRGENVTPGDDYVQRWLPLFTRLRDLRMPVVSAVKGPVVGVGMSLALSADMVVAGKSAYFLQAFTRIGIVPDGGATYILPRLIGKARAMELSLLAERLPAEKALEWGLINRLVDDEELMNEAFSLAGRLAKGPTVAYALTRKAYWKAFENSYEDQFRLEGECLTELSTTADMVEGFTAFAERRDPRFQGK
jgi:2-(1,2-epoxy-1,2-dihydrophenyl)acetyl-CoA isomerase